MYSGLALLAATATSWTGSWTAGTGTSAVAVQLSGARAVVALGAGHADAQTVPLRRSGARVRFTIPGRPALAFDGRIRGGRLSGTTRQGAARGTFSLRPGPAGALFARGFYAGTGEGRRWALVDDPFGPPRVD